MFSVLLSRHFPAVMLAFLAAACTAAVEQPQPVPAEIDKEQFCAYEEVLAERLAKAEAERPRHRMLGWVEWGKVKGTGQVVKTKLDSGAKTTSINAEIVREFEKDGKEYLLYHVHLDDDSKSATFESPITRWVKIRKKTGGHIRRPVVEMELCVGGIPVKGEVNLADRGHFNYPVLVGRNMLKKKNIIVDSSRSFLAEREC